MLGMGIRLLLSQQGEVDGLDGVRRVAHRTSPLGIPTNGPVVAFRSPWVRVLRQAAEVEAEIGYAGQALRRFSSIFLYPIPLPTISPWRRVLQQQSAAEYDIGYAGQALRRTSPIYSYAPALPYAQPWMRVLRRQMDDVDAAVRPARNYAVVVSFRQLFMGSIL